MFPPPSRYVLFVILTLGIRAMIATEVAYSQKKQGLKTATHSPRTLAAPEIARPTLPAVVMIECENGDEISQASGFFVRPGIVVTSYHVIKNMEKGKIRVVGDQIKGSRIFHITFVLAIDERADLALLGVVDAKRAGIPTLPVAAGNAVIGETIYAFGSPAGLSGTMSTGIVSAGLRVFKGRRLLQITAPISHGSSGGPVVDSRGQVVGLAIGSLTGAQNLNFAVPGSLITSLVSRWESGDTFAAIWDLFEPSGDDTWLWLTAVPHLL
jgi:S1-C subfamily serine protease